MSKDSNLPQIPPGPADADYPRRALARLAVSQQARQLADRATNALVPTAPADARGDEVENVQIAFQLVDDARELLTRTVLSAREHGVSWETIGDEHGGITRQSAQERYGPAVAEWDDVLDRPTERSGAFLSSRLPDGLDEPERTAARLDAWAANHVGAGSFRRQQAEENDVGIVSAGLEAHSAITRLNTALRYREHLQAREAVSAAAWDRFAELKAAARSAAEHEQHPSGSGERKPAPNPKRPASNVRRGANAQNPG